MGLLPIRPVIPELSRAAAKLGLGRSFVRLNRQIPSNHSQGGSIRGATLGLSGIAGHNTELERAQGTPCG